MIKAILERDFHVTTSTTYPAPNRNGSSFMLKQ